MPNQALNLVVSLSHLAMQVYSIPFKKTNQSTVQFSKEGDTIVLERSRMWFVFSFCLLLFDSVCFFVTLYIEMLLSQKTFIVMWIPISAAVA